MFYETLVVLVSLNERESRILTKVLVRDEL